MNLAIHIHTPSAWPANWREDGRPPRETSGIGVAHTDPVIVAENPCACDLVELLQLAAADLTDLAVRDLDLSIIAQHNYHNQAPYLSARVMKLSEEASFR